MGEDELRGKVVVITGASSGIGRATALAFAGCGCRLVLAARRAQSLESTAASCRRVTKDVLVAPMDVTSESEVRELADQALAAFGSIDVWINNAGVTLFGSLEGAPFEEHRRVIETNLYGSIFGARAVVPIFRRQRRGVLINVGSILSKVGQPFVPSYVISKFALRGMSEALRAELADEPDVHVCTIFPYTVDTEHFEDGANETGRHAYALPPVQAPAKVARAIVSLARRPRRELHVPKIAVLGLALHSAFPRVTERLLLHAAQRWHLDAGGQPRTEGNLFQPPPHAGSTRGERSPRTSTLHFLGRVAGDLLRMQGQALGRWLRPGAVRPRAGSV